MSRKKLVAQPTVLAFDTSSLQGGVAILKGDRLLSRQIWRREKSHSELLTPTIENSLAEADISIQELTLLAVGIGPGSFTGIRIAVNAARSLSYALGLKILAFDTSEILTAGVPRRDLPVLTLVNAHKNLLYTSISIASSSPPTTAALTRTGSTTTWRERSLPLGARSIEELERLVQSPHLCVGDGFAESAQTFSPELRSKLIRDSGCSDFPLPEVLGRLAYQRLDLDTPLDWNGLQALYIRSSGAEEKIQEG